MRKLLIAFALVLFCAIPAWADVHTAATCGYTDVLSAYNASSNGDNVLMPAGTCDWGANRLIITKNITLVGSGEASTFLTGGNSIDPGGSITISGAAPFVRVTKFAVQNPSVGSKSFILVPTNGATGWRIDHVTFSGMPSGRYIQATGKGVIDHCTFSISTGSGAQAISVYGSSVANGLFGNTDTGGWEWSQGTFLGTDNAVYIEDNIFNWDQGGDDAIDAYQGARLVVRYNEFHKRGIGFHGSDSGDPRHGVHSYEIYENTFDIASGANMFTTINLRGGTGVIYSNTASAQFNSFVRLTNYRSCATYGQWGTCNGANSLDENSNGYGYACLDQVGTTGPGHTKQPLYLWNNTRGGSAATGINANGCANETAVIQVNRDWYNATQMPGYTAYTYPHPLVGEESPGVDATPAAFSFVDQYDVSLSTVIYSSSITVLDIDTTVNVTISGTGCEYQKNGTGSWYTTSILTGLNDTIQLRTTSSSSSNTATSCYLTVGGVSDTWTVTTQELPVLISPSSGAVSVGYEPATFTWSVVSGAVMYQIQVATDSGFSNIVVDTQTELTTYSTDVLSSNTTYYWRVRALR